MYTVTNICFICTASGKPDVFRNAFFIRYTLQGQKYVDTHTKYVDTWCYNSLHPSRKTFDKILESCRDFLPFSNKSVREVGH